MSAAGATFGRYVILERIGAGGMGVVWKAYDPELDRRVALKLVRLDRGRNAGSEDPTHADEPRERLLREAQAMAKLAHPNVIAVHDVGTLGDEVYVAMELVDGPNLNAWLKQRRRPWREILHAFVQAGRGLAAAHAAKLVHRDFKPDNVLVGSDGRVRVTDFGLSRALDQAQPAELAAGPSPRSDRLFDSLTTTGSVVGTPAFMSPEQHLGRATDPRSDQFSFCVALYEALAGSRPFAAANIEELTAAVVGGAIKAPPPGRMPRFVQRALQRGLRPRPDDRFPSMDALLAALDRDPRPLRRGAIAAAAVAALVVAAVLIARGRAPSCAGEGRLAGVWDAERRQAVHRAFLASGAAFAEEAWRGAGAGLDGYAGSLAAMHREACEATHVRGEQSSELLDLRMDCLTGRLENVRALVALFARADRGVVERALPAVAGLPSLDECGDIKQLLGRPHPPRDEAWRARADELRRAVAEVHALKLAGKFKEGLARAETLPAPAAALGDRSLEANALVALGDLQSRAGDSKAGEKTLAEAARAALAGRDPRVAAQAEIQLGQIAGMELRQAERGLEHLRTASALVEGLGGDPLLEAQLAGAEGQILNDGGHAEEGLARLLRSRALLEKVRGPDDIDVATAWNDIGGAYRMVSRFPDALDALTRSLAIREKALGPDHPFVATSLVNIGNVYYTQGRHAEAQPYYARSLAIREKALGPDHPRVADGLISLAQNLDSLGRSEEALVALRRAQGIQERSVGPDHPDVGRTLNSIGDAEKSLGHHEQALAAYRSAIAIKEKALGPEHPTMAISIYSLGDTLLALHRGSEALVEFERALAIDAKVYGADGVELAYDLTGIGRAHLELARPAAAIPPLERALALRTATPGDPTERGETEFMLARALWDANRDRDRALALATRARAVYAAAGEGAKKELAAIDAWLRGRPLVQLR